MTMHLEGPWLSTTGKLKSKRRRYASADAAKKARELAQAWEENLKKWDAMAPKFGKKSGSAAPQSKSLVVTSVVRRETPRYPSLNGGVDSGAAVLAPQKIYTGTKVKGIGTMHKSNAVPIFSDDDAMDIARMRR